MSAVSSTNLGSIFTLASGVRHRNYFHDSVACGANNSTTVSPLKRKTVCRIKYNEDTDSVAPACQGD